MTEARFITGDVFDVVATLPDDSVDLVVTSPPFLALRSYLAPDHAAKANEIGGEGTPAAFLDVMLSLTAELGRVLTPHGSICVELGDTYAGSGGAGGDYNQGGWREGQRPFEGSMKHARVESDGRPPIQDRHGRRQRGGTGWPLDKSLCGIPTLFAWSLAYGVNLLTGEESPAGRWRVRNVLTWCRPNPPVGAPADKFRPATSFVTVATRARQRWFDLDAVRTDDRRNSSPAQGEPKATAAVEAGVGASTAWAAERTFHANGGAPPLDWFDDRESEWQPFVGMTTQPYAGAHYATFPSRLPRVLIEAMCPRDVCRTCGEPRRREVGEAEYSRTATDRVPARLNMREGERVADGVNQFVGTGANTSVTRHAETVGWSDCGHDDYRRGVVLDPFAGTGTTGVAATGLNRDAVLIDVDDRNTDLARERVGMFLVDEGQLEMFGS